MVEDKLPIQQHQNQVGGTVERNENIEVQNQIKVNNSEKNGTQSEKKTPPKIPKMVKCTESTLPVVEIKNTWDDTTNIWIDASSLQTEKDNIEKMDGSSRFENQFMTQKTSIQLPPPFFSFLLVNIIIQIT